MDEQGDVIVHDGYMVTDVNPRLSLPDRRFECSKGHRWSFDYFGVDTGVLLVVCDETPFCVRCLLEVLKGKVGIVREVS